MASEMRRNEAIGQWKLSRAQKLEMLAEGRKPSGWLR